MLAAAYPKSKSTYLINIYDSNTTELIWTLKGHANTINQIVWSNKD